MELTSEAAVKFLPDLLEVAKEVPAATAPPTV